MGQPLKTGPLKVFNSYRRRAERWFPLKDKCERCLTAPARDRHHKDGDARNNVESNIAHLCRKCHMLEDGRLERLAATGARLAPLRVVPPKPCIICNVPSKITRRGRCCNCNEFLRRNGFERTELKGKWRDKAIQEGTYQSAN